jgi:hypothetical protein
LDPATFAQSSAPLAQVARFEFSQQVHLVARMPTVVVPLAAHQTQVAVQRMASRTQLAHWPAPTGQKPAPLVARTLATA